MEQLRSEIGSEFWTGSTKLNGTGVEELLPLGMESRYTLCGRTALELLLRDAVQTRGVRKAYLPSYCCHTMIEPFTQKGIAVLFYNVFFTDTGIDTDFCEENDCDLVFLMDYFGFRREKTRQLAIKQKTLGKCVLFDATHSLLCENVDYGNFDYVFGSFRKWFGVNGGFCAKRGEWNNFPTLTQNLAYTQQRNTAFDDKMQFMSGYPVEKERFLTAFSQAEERLEADYTSYAPDDRSMQILEGINVDFIRSRRRENAAYVIECINMLQSSAVFSPYRKVLADECPLFVPLSVIPAKRAELRRLLIENSIYLPIHWPLSDLHTVDAHAGRIYDSELSFVCDQRYGLGDMERAIKIIRSF